MRRIRCLFIGLGVLAVGIDEQVGARDQNAQVYSAFKSDRFVTGRPLPANPNVDPFVNWPTFYGVQQTGMIDASFDCFGNFGIAYFPYWPDVAGWPTVSFVTPSPNGSEYLFAGSVWVGGIVEGDTLVSVGSPGWHPVRNMFPTSDQFSPRAGTVTKFDYKTDYSMRAEFADTTTQQTGFPYSDGFHPLNLLIANRNHIWRTAPYNNTIIYDMVITNIGKKRIESGYIGFFWDADVCFDCQNTGGFLDDLSGSLRDQGIGYVIDNNGDLTNEHPSPKIFAFKYLYASFAAADTNFNWWICNTNPSLDFGPRQKDSPDRPFHPFREGNLGTPVSVGDIYRILSFKEWDYDQIFTASIMPDDSIWMYPTPVVAGDFVGGGDMRFLLSLGPFDLKSDSSIRVMFATFTGDSVHTVPGNLSNLPENPNAYLANLNFGPTLANAARSDSLIDSLLDAGAPAIGLHVAYVGNDSAVIRWDPWVLPEVEGYEICLSEVPPEALPYPGVPAPWLRPDNLDHYCQSVPATYRYAFHNLDSSKLYLASVANRTSTQVGDPGSPVYVRLGGHSPAPRIEAEYVFAQVPPLASRRATVKWTEVAGVNVDHYNIYKFADSVQALARYHAFYDEGFRAATLTPKDTFDVNGIRYYYYAMDVYAHPDSGVVSFADIYVQEGNVYVVAAVDKQGFELEFSAPVTAHLVPARGLDILVLSNSSTFLQCSAKPTSIYTFYSQLLSGYQWDFYNVADSTKLANCPSQSFGCLDWREFMPYRLVIIDDNLRDMIWTATYEENQHGLTRYLLSGGKVAYFGQFNGMTGRWSASQDAAVALTEPHVQRFFGVDSVHSVPILYYFARPAQGKVDSAFGFIEAQSVDSGTPGLAFDSTARPCDPAFYSSWWGTTTGPAASSFRANQRGEVTHRYRSLYPELSRLEGDPVGVRTWVEGTATYLFGFHLWYMKPSDARQLVEWIMEDEQTGVKGPETPLVPRQFRLTQNYPNPFNMSTRIAFDVPRRAEVRLEIFNILGQKVLTLLSETKPAGVYSVEWDGTDQQGRAVSSGVYLYRLTDGQTNQARKMILLK